MNDNTKRIKSNKGSYKRKTRQDAKTSESKSKKRTYTDDRMYVDSTNDMSWYTHIPELLSDSASIPYSWAAGNKHNISKLGLEVDDGALDPNYAHVPFAPFGVAVFRLLLTPGMCAEEKSSPMNIMSKHIYSFVRHMNSGHANYDAPDLLFYLLAMDSIYSFINYCKRAYGLNYTYNGQNRYMPETILNATGIKHSIIQNNPAEFREWLNTFIAKASTFAVPDTMDYFSRHSWLFSNVFAEGMSPKSQIYVPIPDGFYTYVETDPGVPGYLRYHKIPGFNTFDELREYGNHMIDSLMNSEDINIMSGDILKAYQGNIFGLSYIEPQYNVTPVYDVNVLEQFANSNIIDIDYNVRQLHEDHSVADIYQDPFGYIHQDLPIKDKSTVVAAIGKILRTDDVEGSIERTVYNTRLMSGAKVINPILSDSQFQNVYHSDMSSIGVGKLNTYGTEVVTAVTLLGIDDTVHHPIFINVTDNSEDTLKYLSVSSMFKYLPLAYVGSIVTDLDPSYSGIKIQITTANVNHVIGPVDNFAILNNSNLREIHTAVQFSLFNLTKYSNTR